MGKVVQLYKLYEIDMVKFIDQKQLHDPANKLHGDCWAACIASITGIEYDELPNVNDYDYENGWSEFYMAMFLFLEDKGFELYNVKLKDFQENYESCIFSGKSPRGDWNHSVVWNGGIVHDPHPDKTGIDSIKTIQRIDEIV